MALKPDPANPSTQTRPGRYAGHEPDRCVQPVALGPGVADHRDPGAGAGHLRLPRLRVGLDRAAALGPGRLGVLAVHRHERPGRQRRSPAAVTFHPLTSPSSLSRVRRSRPLPRRRYRFAADPSAGGPDHRSPPSRWAERPDPPGPARGWIAPMTDLEFDVVVVGSGGGAMAGAMLAQKAGLRTVVVEKTDRIGGTSAYSGGACWLPGTQVQQRAGIPDSTDSARTYLAAVLPQPDQAEGRGVPRRGPAAGRDPRGGPRAGVRVAAVPGVLRRPRPGADRPVHPAGERAPRRAAGGRSPRWCDHPWSATAPGRRGAGR